MQTMPEDPIDMIDDLAKMGIYKEESFKIADAHKLCGVTQRTIFENVIERQS